MPSDAVTGGANTRAGYFATAADAVVVVAAVASLVSGTATALFVWLVVATLYLIAMGFTLRRLTARGLRDNRVGALDTLSWVLPVVASLAGVQAALLALVGADAGAGPHETSLLGLWGIPTSWLLLHVGFANIYAGHVDRAQRSGVESLDFPGEPQPGGIEFVYFALTIGATFATSDVEVRSRNTRSLVAVHSVLSFFFNALVVAAAFQVLQQLATG